MVGGVDGGVYLQELSGCRVVVAGPQVVDPGVGVSRTEPMLSVCRYWITLQLLRVARLHLQGADDTGKILRDEPAHRWDLGVLIEPGLGGIPQLL